MSASSKMILLARGEDDGGFASQYIVVKPKNAFAQPHGYAQAWSGFIAEQPIDSVGLHVFAIGTAHGMYASAPAYYYCADWRTIR